MLFKKIDIKEINENPITLIRDMWPLLSAGTPDDFNFMTINWGMIGELWFKNAMTTYVRHSRHTFKYMEEQDYFTISVLPEAYKKALGIAGSKSGRDCDKVEETGLTPHFLDGAVTFEEAELVIYMKKVYKQDMPLEDFIDKAIIDEAYPEGDLHRFYVGEIVSIYRKNQ